VCVCVCVCMCVCVCVCVCRGERIPGARSPRLLQFVRQRLIFLGLNYGPLCMYVCMYVCMNYVCMYLGNVMYVCVCMYVYE